MRSFNLKQTIQVLAGSGLLVTLSLGNTSDWPATGVTPPPPAYPHYPAPQQYAAPNPSPGSYYINGLQQEMNRLRNQIEQLHTDRMRLMDELQQAYQHINQLNTQLSRMGEHSRQQAAANSQLQHQLSVANAGYRNEWQRAEQQQSRIQQLQNERAQLQSQLAQHTQQVAELQSQLNAQPESRVAQPAEPRPSSRSISQAQQTALTTLTNCIAAVEPGNMQRCNPEQPMMIEGVSFEYDSHELTDESRQVLSQVADILKQQADIKLEVAGHTDTQGHPAYNIWLSQLRAESVRDFLIRQGVAAANLVAKGYGGEQPIADNNTWHGLHKNRRVELRWIN